MFLFIVFVICQLISAAALILVVWATIREAWKSQPARNRKWKEFFQSLRFEFTDLLEDNSANIFLLVGFIGGFWVHWLTYACLGLFVLVLLRCGSEDTLEAAGLNSLWEFFSWGACLGLGIWHHWMFYAPALIILIGRKRILRWMGICFARYPEISPWLGAMIGLAGVLYFTDLDREAVKFASFLVLGLLIVMQIVFFTIRWHMSSLKRAVAEAEESAVQRALGAIPRKVVNAKHGIWVLVDEERFNNAFERHVKEVLEGARSHGEPIMVRECTLFASHGVRLAPDEQEIVHSLIDLNVAIKGCHVMIHPQLGVPFITKDRERRVKQLQFLLGK